MDYQIEKLTESDWDQVRAIYLEGIATGNATFETEAPSWESWDKSHSKTCRLAVKSGNQVLGWAALSPVSGRCVYAGVADVSIYIGQSFKGEGIGTALLRSMIELSEKEGFWTLQAGIFPENTSSIKLHNKAGFREVGIRERLGKMNGVWRDVVLLERRNGIL
ncbi:GNAT family N-acetyltransferase [Bacillus sp. V2I10]|uniref:GNAT family N-acetyltransferase n=1 Tax=Bacillus sp. V2I10 TaxID=3042276 RepID=UPI00278B4963|nr:GNAT family N-acetyltransferase [Bacillus sp. V2I10]MDQ0861493.1 L-amino acid N-acyltransferase YncA [Bacillus sp. V2I10]